MMRNIALAIAAVAALAATASAQPATADIKTVNSPRTLDWPVTTRLSALEVTGGGVRPVFDKCESWPDVVPPGWGGPLRFTLHLVLDIGGEWFESGIIQFWACDHYNGGPIYDDNQIARNWVYDSRWGNMAGHQPQPGELIGFFVSAGNSRGQDDHRAAERSQVVYVRMPAGPQTFTAFAAEEAAAPIAPPLAPAPPVFAPPPPPPVFAPPAAEGVLLATIAARVEQLYQLEAEQSRADADAHAAIDKNVTDGRAENRGFFSAVTDHWKAITATVATFASGWIAKAKVGQ